MKIIRKHPRLIRSVALGSFAISLFLSSGCDDDKNPSRCKNETPTGDTIKDIDGNVYQIVKIGDQWWMAENLKTARYRSGEAIQNIVDELAWKNLTSGAVCGYFNNESSIEDYGRLYNWYAVTDSRGIAPAGWHVPTDEEWQTLITYLGGITVAGSKMKEAGILHWSSPNTDATNESGFTALPGGYRRSDNGEYIKMGQQGTFWTLTFYDDQHAYSWNLFYNKAVATQLFNVKSDGVAVRCVKD